MFSLRRDGPNGIQTTVRSVPSRLDVTEVHGENKPTQLMATCASRSSGGTQDYFLDFASPSATSCSS